MICLIIFVIGIMIFKTHIPIVYHSSNLLVPHQKALGLALCGVGCMGGDDVS